jgi:hypothetical protein
MTEKDCVSDELCKARMEITKTQLDAIKEAIEISAKRNRDLVLYGIGIVGLGLTVLEIILKVI